MTALLMEHSEQLSIGIVSYDYAPAIGGLGILAKTYVDELRKQNPAVNFIVLSPSSAADERGGVLGRFRWKKSGGCPLFSLSLLFSLHQCIRRRQLNVIHVHAGSGGVFLLRKPPCRVVVTSHHTYSQEARLVFRKSPLKRLWKMCMSVAERRTYKLADLVCCVSADTRDELVMHYGISPEKVSVIDNPICTDILQQYRDKSKVRKTVLFIGRLEKRKGIMILLEAFRTLSKEFPDVTLRLVGRNMMGKTLQKWMTDHQLKDRIVLLGYIEDPLRYREMAEAAVLVVPSLLEGFGLVAAEAMMLGKCVIASDAPGLRSIVEDKKVGYLFHSGDAQDLLRVLRSTLMNAEQRLAIEREAMNTAERRFNLQARTAELMKALDSRIH